MIKSAMILSGSGFYDGAEIQESVLAYFALAISNVQVDFFAPDIEQHHVVNHLTGEEIQEKRNVLVESARIARGEIKPFSELDASKYDGFVFPGGFGVAKNFSKIAFDGVSGEINKEMAAFVRQIVSKKKPLVAICMAPAFIAMALRGSGRHPQLTVGNFKNESPYEIQNIAKNIAKCGSTHIQKEVHQALFDSDYGIISTPAYMMKTTILEVQRGIQSAIEYFVKAMAARK